MEKFDPRDERQGRLLTRSETRCSLPPSGRRPSRRPRLGNNGLKARLAHLRTRDGVARASARATRIAERSTFQRVREDRDPTAAGRFNAGRIEAEADIGLAVTNMRISSAHGDKRTRAAPPRT